MERLDEDGVRAICNRTGDKPTKEVSGRLEQDQLAAIQWPADGKLLGDWKSGERIAQSGRGMMWSDGAGSPGGGSCYNCHQIAPQEKSFGTVGPSLYQFGKTRGYAPDMQKYVYGKIYNAKAYNLCSAMPAFRPHRRAHGAADQRFGRATDAIRTPQSMSDARCRLLPCARSCCSTAVIPGSPCAAER